MHNDYIEKIYYLQQLDLVIMHEISQCVLKVY